MPSTLRHQFCYVLGGQVAPQKYLRLEKPSTKRSAMTTPTNVFIECHAEASNADATDHSHRHSPSRPLSLEIASLCRLRYTRWVFIVELQQWITFTSTPRIRRAEQVAKKKEERMRTRDLTPDSPGFSSAENSGGGIIANCSSKFLPNADRGRDCGRAEVKENLHVERRTPVGR
ncbi:Protein of unknown function [Gryllus bimaculatus]|nr:Protein of unknown function [Gryllus bimaculatus]